MNTSQTSTSNVVNGVITVGARNHQAYQFGVPADAYNAQISGTFTASGGSGNDIIVYVFDSTNYVNWENGHQSSAYYNSGQVTTDSFSINLPAGGTYYLVYDNSFSFLSSKNVNTQANLAYSESVQTVVPYTTTYTTS